MAWSLYGSNKKVVNDVNPATEMTEEQRAMRDVARDFVRDHVVAQAAAWDREARVPVETLNQLGSSGFFGVMVPTEWGGAGADFFSYIYLTEELSYGDAGLCNTINATNSFANNVLAFGTEGQKERWLRPVAEGRHIACMLLSEPQAGSDAVNLKTRAELRGDRYVINGSKVFITSGATLRIRRDIPLSGKS